MTSPHSEGQAFASCKKSLLNLLSRHDLLHTLEYLLYHAKENHFDNGLFGTQSRAASILATLYGREERVDDMALAASSADADITNSTNNGEIKQMRRSLIGGVSDLNDDGWLEVAKTLIDKLRDVIEGRSESSIANVIMCIECLSISDFHIHVLVKNGIFDLLVLLYGVKGTREREDGEWGGGGGGGGGGTYGYDIIKAREGMVDTLVNLCLSEDSVRRMCIQR